MNQSSNSNQHPDPDDSVHQLVTETSYDFSNQIDTDCKLKTEPENDESVDQLETETSFEFSSIQIDANFRPLSQNNDQSAAETEQLIPESLENDASIEQSTDEINAGINHLLIEVDNGSKSPEMTSAAPESDDEDDEDEEDEDEEDEEGEFTFMYVGDNDLTNTELFESGQIRFPLFDQSLLSTGDNRLPLTVPVDNVFIESPRRSNGESNGISTGTFCAISKDSQSGSPEINIKSNSTGFSKLWRFRDNMNRSNSDGRDAFVFFQSPTGSSSNGKSNGVTEIGKNVDGKVTEKDAASSSSTNGKVNGINEVDGISNGKVTEKAVKKGKKKVKSAIEVYLKQKGGKSEDDRRRSYLPYRPGLMGFFTNVNGGLSKNVHPF